MKTARPPRILRKSAASLLALAVCITLPAKATVLTWTGTVDNKWETSGNWTPALTPFTDPFDSDLIFTGSHNTSTLNDNASAGNPTELQSITFDSKAASFTLSGNQIQLAGGATITNNSSSLQIISFSSGTNASPGTGGIRLFNISFNNGGAVIPFFYFTAAVGDMLITSDVSFQTDGTLVVGGSHNVTMTGVIFDVAGATGQLVKNGTGTLRLTGNSTYGGNTTVNGGLLQVDGSIASPATFVNSLGTLGGNGIIGGNVYNSGNVAPGDSPGTLTIKKNYYQSKDGTLTIEIASKKKHDLLAVSGTANLDGTLRLVKVGSGPRLNYGDKVTIVTAQGGVDGEFSKVDVSSFSDTLIKPKVIYHDTSVVVQAGQGSFRDFADGEGLTFNQKAVASGLDQLAFHNNAPKLLRFLDSRPLVELPSDFDKIAPEELASVFNIGVSLATLQMSNQQQRNSEVRAGASGFSAAGFHTAGSGPSYSGAFGVAGPTGNEGKDSKKEFVPAEENRWGTFITGVGQWVDINGDGNARGYDIETGGFTLGVDYKFTPNLAIGISAGYAGTGVDLTQGGRVFVNGGKLGLYGTYFTGGFYVDAAVNGGYNSYDTRRAGLNGSARGSTDGGELNTLIGTGYDFHLGALTIGPTLNFQYTYLGIDNFDERGTLAPLNIRSQSGESLRTALGFKASYDWKVGGVLIKPELRAAWQHEYGDASFDVEAGFRDASNSGFTVRGPEVGRDSLLLGAGFAILWNERTSTYVYYDGDIARTNYESHSVSGGVRFSF